MPLLTLPSGAVAPLECPGLLPLLAGDGSCAAIARATLAHDEIDAESLSAEDAFSVTLWALRRFAASDEAIGLTAVCRAFGEPPSRRLHIVDRILAWIFDRDCMLALKEARVQAVSGEHPERRRDGALAYSVPDTWTGDEDD